ncbi:MAG: (R)-benzylsuccinyl-CoA dehydrogenase [Cyanobacteria bacterium RYN_339]|nr:(R)-benzylsuccinyl-CoA dehydrogenase [Cyanobacteria bacterium RYN_339]
MDFSPAPATQALVDAIRAFMAAEVLPHDAEWLQQPFDELPLEPLRDHVRAQGWWAPSLPRAWGGLGLDLVDLALVGEVLGQSPFGHYLFGCQAPDAGNMELLLAFGTPTQQERFLRPVAEGRQRGCFAMTEPDTPGSNPTQLACRARREGDHFVLDGRKWFATGADGAAYALVMAVTNPDAPPHQRASVFLVPLPAPGLTLVRNIPIMGHGGQGWASHGELQFDGVQAELLGEEGAGFMLGQARLGPGRIHHCMRWLGVCERAFALMAARARGRSLTADKTLADQPLLQAAAAALRARIDAARLLVLHTAWTIEKQGFKEARTQVSLIKFHVAQLLQDVVDQAVQVHGALGLTSDTVLAYFYAHERGARIYDGPDEVHLLAAGKQVLR